MFKRFTFSPIEFHIKNRIPEILVIFYVLLLLADTALGQDIIWSRTYGGMAADAGWGIAETADSGFIVVAESYSFGYDKQVYLIRTEANGDTLWTKVFGGSGLEQCLSVQQTTDGGYVMSGTTTSYGKTYQAYLIKTKPDGSLSWFKTYGGNDWENCPSVQQTTDGGYILARWTYSYGAGDADVYLVKTDSLGNLRWFKTYGGSHEDMAFHVEQTTEGEYIIVGNSKSFGPAVSNVYLIKTNPQGDTLWTRTYCPFSYGWNADYAYSCQQTSDGGYIISGVSVTDTNRAYLIKTDPNGDTLWIRLFTKGLSSDGHSIRQTSDGGYIVAGSAMSPRSDYENDVYVIKLDPNGDTLWTRTYGDIGGDVAETVIQAADGSFMMVGCTSSCGDTPLDVLLLKISPVPLTIPRGDANGEGVFDIGDVIYEINYLLKDGPPSNPLLAGDTDCNGVVELEDIVNLVRYLFQAGPDLGCRCL
jgi:hypothetical protein